MSQSKQRRLSDSPFGDPVDPAQGPIHVTRPFLPPLDEYIPYLEKIWESRQLTNGGPFHQQFEHALCETMDVPHVSLFANATLALVVALQALRITGEVITTPFSFVATSHALLWNGLRPVFVDVNPETLNLDPGKVEAAITPQTTAILPVHCYGRACETQALQSIADTYNLKLIYDAAHSFGVKTERGNLFSCGDLSVLSFHATKAFNTFEGGVVVCPDAKIKKRIDHLKNFGFVDEVTVVAPGINGKMSELNASLGLLQLKHFAQVLERRAVVDARYRARLKGLEGLRCLPLPPGQRHNHAYFPILVEPEFGLARDAVYDRLRAAGIYARRYFYPLISDFPMYRGLPSAAPALLPAATKAAEQVLCLPIYPELSEADQDRVVAVLLDAVS